VVRHYLESGAHRMAADKDVEYCVRRWWRSSHRNLYRQHLFAWATRRWRACLVRIHAPLCLSRCLAHRAGRACGASGRTGAAIVCWPCSMQSISVSQRWRRSRGACLAQGGTALHYRAMASSPSSFAVAQHKRAAFLAYAPYAATAGAPRGRVVATHSCGSVINVQRMRCCAASARTRRAATM